MTAGPWATRDHLQPLARGLFLVGAALAIGAGLLGEYGWFDYGVHDWWRASPLSFVQRFGSVLLLLSIVAGIANYVTRLTPPLQGLAEESLLVYAVHVALLYGSLWTIGLGPRLGPQPPGGRVGVGRRDAAGDDRAGARLERHPAPASPARRGVPGGDARRARLPPGLSAGSPGTRRPPRLALDRTGSVGTC